MYNSLSSRECLKSSADQLSVLIDRRLNYFRCFIEIALKRPYNQESTITYNLSTRPLGHDGEISDLGPDASRPRSKILPLMTSRSVDKWNVIAFQQAKKL